MGCCLGGCFRLIAFALWRAIFAALVALLLTRIDSYVESSGKSGTAAGRAWRLYRSRSAKRRKGAASTTSVVDTEGRPQP